MDQLEAFQSFIRSRPWQPYESRLIGGFGALAAHALVLSLFVFSVYLFRDPPSDFGKGQVEVSLLMNTDSNDPKPELKLDPVTPKTPVISAPVIDIMPELTELEMAAPLVTNQTASRGDSEYYARLTRHTLRFMRYPAEAKLAGQQGVVWIHIIVDRQGKVRFVDIEKSSGVPLLDKETLALISRAAPMPPFPSNVTREYFNTMIPFGYRLQ